MLLEYNKRSVTRVQTEYKLWDSSQQNIFIRTIRPGRFAIAGETSAVAKRLDSAPTLYSIFQVTAYQ